MHRMTAPRAKIRSAATLKMATRSRVPPRVSSQTRTASPPIPDGRIWLKKSPIITSRQLSANATGLCMRASIICQRQATRIVRTSIVRTQTAQATNPIALILSPTADRFTLLGARPATPP